MDANELIRFVAELALTFIFVSVATSNNSKQTVIDQKQDLRTAKEDIMAELKETKRAYMRESEISTKAIIDIIRAELKAEGNNKQKDLI